MQAVRNYFDDPASKANLLAILASDARNPFDNAILTLALDFKDQFFNYFSRATQAGHWHALMRPAWLPGYQDYIEDPRFFESMKNDGAVELWEQRGYPDGCVRIDLPDHTRLDCTPRYNSIQ